jgi:hypothetical protein
MLLGRSCILINTKLAVERVQMKGKDKEISAPAL